MKNTYRSGLFALLFTLLFTQGNAQIVINEYCAANKSGTQDNFGNYSDWVELYNAGTASVNIGGYFLSDEAANLDKWEIPPITMAPGQKQIIWASGANITAGPDYHTKFKLTQVKQETIILSDDNIQVMDSIKIIPCQMNHSRGRATDGAATWKIFTNPSPGAANSGGYDAYANRPLFSLQPGFYTAAAQFNVTSNQSGITIRYTTDGTEPTVTSPTIGGAFYIVNTTVIRARAYSSNPNILPSFIETNTYFLNTNHNGHAVISMCGDFNGLFGGFGGEIMSTFEYFNSGGVMSHEGDGDVRGHGNDSWAYDQKGMRFYSRDDYGYANNIEYKLFDVSPREEFDVVILKAGASDNYPGGTQQSGLETCHLRDVYTQSMSQKFDLHLDERSWAPTAMYLNGQYWGVYEIRERIDADYTDFYYDQEQKDVDMLAYWGGLTIEEGSDTAWNALYTFMTTNNLAIQSNYDYVDERLDVMSLIDYFILNTYTVNSDWLNWNTAWWRGRGGAGVKWRYRLWDMDNTYNLGQNYTGVGTTSYMNDPCNPTTLFQGDPDIPHTDMWNALDANPTFHDLYINRYADLLNTMLNCDSALAHFDWVIAQIAPEMPKQIARWGGSMAEWNEHLDSMRAQITGRCNVVDSLMGPCFNVTGPYDITVLVDPPNSGQVRVNTIVPTSYPWTGSYFGGVTVSFYEVATMGFDLVSWTVNNHTPILTGSNDSISINLNQGDTIIAHFDTTIAIDPRTEALYGFKVFPVPSSDEIFIGLDLANSTEYSLALYNLEGTKVAELKSTPEGGVPAGSYRETVNLAQLGITAGVYFVRFESPDYSATKKVVYLPR